MSSPNLNNLIIVGSMCTFASVVLLGIDTRILSNENFVKLCYDSKLLLILAGLLFVDILVLTLWAVISPFRMSVMELPQLHFDDRVVIPEIEKCESNHSAVFQAVLYATKGILMILGCFLAWETRHVNVPALNDSKYIGMSVYNVVVMSILGLSISVILQDSKLLLILAGLLFVDILVLTLWAVISPFRMSVMELPQLHFDDRVVIPEIEKCESNHSAVFQAVLYATKGILMILGCFLAWETRHVNVPALNDSKYIGMSVYNVVVMSILGLSISVILQ
ncbi:7 transmembrane receptor, partial [Teladorsagia circumcincta]